MRKVIQTHQMIVPRTAHYYTMGDLTMASHIIIAFHGYGQLASKLIQKFSGLEDCFIIAPEGLSKFYWNGVRGNVVSSWMTSHHRNDEILDQINYLNQIWDYVHLNSKDKAVHLFGFSQGCATIWRWLEQEQPKIQSLCLWAGWLPEDVDFKILNDYLNTVNLEFIYGDQDEYLPDERMDVLKSIARSNNIPLHYTKYNGTHRVHRSVLQEWFKRMIKLK